MKKIIKEELLKLIDEKYAKFNSKLCPDTKKSMIGIRVPILRDFAKRLVSEYDIERTIEELLVEEEEFFEEVQLKGLLIGYLKIGLTKKFKLIEKFLPKVDSWAITDTFVPTLKIKKTDLEETWQFILNFINSKEEFSVRFSIIMMIDYFINDEYIDKVIKELDKIRHDGYYVKMAVAWTLAEIGIKYNDKAMKYLKEKNNLDDFTYNKTLQKMIESFRIDDNQKNILRKMKRK